VTLDHFVMVRIHARQVLEYKALKYNQQKNSKQFVPELCLLLTTLQFDVRPK